MVVFNGIHDRCDFAIKVCEIDWLAIGVIGLFGALCVWWKFKERLPMANRIFSTFGWCDPSGVDLSNPRKTQKAG
jgi:hypothetical protein